MFKYLTKSLLVESDGGIFFFFWGGGGGKQTYSIYVYAPYTYISLILCLNQCFKLFNLFLAPDAAEDASADAAADINNR